MEFDHVVKKRKSVHSFKQQKADWRLVMEAIDSSLQAPFAGNNNNLKFLIIEDPETIDKIASLAQQRWMNQVDTLVVVCSQEIQLERLYGERGRIYNRQQAGAAIQNFLLKITDLGLASCWVGAFPDEQMRTMLKIPKDVLIEALLPVGYEKASSKHKPAKKRLEPALSWEKWGEGRRPSLFKEGYRHHSANPAIKL